jgi:hypothetical protein
MVYLVYATAPFGGRISVSIGTAEAALRKAREYEAQGFLDVRVRDQQGRVRDVRKFGELVGGWLPNA